MLPRLMTPSFMNPRSIHARFMSAAGLVSLSAIGMGLARIDGARISDASLVLVLAVIATLALTARWYRQHPERAATQLAEGQAAIALSGAYVTLVSALGLAFGWPTAVPAFFLGAFTVLIAFAAFAAIALQPEKRVMRVKLMARDEAGRAVERVAYRLDR